MPFIPPLNEQKARLDRQRVVNLLAPCLPVIARRGRRRRIAGTPRVIVKARHYRNHDIFMPSFGIAGVKLHRFLPHFFRRGNHAVRRPMRERADARVRPFLRHARAEHGFRREIPINIRDNRHHVQRFADALRHGINDLLKFGGGQFLDKKRNDEKRLAVNAQVRGMGFPLRDHAAHALNRLIQRVRRDVARLPRVRVFIRRHVRWQRQTEPLRMPPRNLFIAEIFLRQYRLRAAIQPPNHPRAEQAVMFDEANFEMFLPRHFQ